MKNKKILLAILAIALVLGMTACKDGGGGGSTPKANTDPKEITITGITEEALSAFNASTSKGAFLALITSGTDGEPIAWCYYSKPITANMTFSLFDSADDHRWTGTGTFDVGIMANDGNYNPIWGASAVKITAKSTTVAFSKFTKIEE